MAEAQGTNQPETVLREKTSEVRNVLLVVAALIAAITFQAGVNPPGGAWQETKLKTDGVTVMCEAGKSVYATNNPDGYFRFLLFNTISLSASFSVINFLAYGFPFYLEIWVASFAMYGTYGAAISALTPKITGRIMFVLLVPMFPPFIRGLLNCFRKSSTTRRWMEMSESVRS